jgi:hypothetical protein
MRGSEAHIRSFLSLCSYRKLHPALQEGEPAYINIGSR